MGKRKRPSTHALSQEEIWDDSALIRSWDEAVAEYEFYHSIAAKGEDVEEVLRLAELEEHGGAVPDGMMATEIIADGDESPIREKDEFEAKELEDGEVDEEEGTNVGLDQDLRGGTSKNATIGPQLQPAKSSAVNTESLGKKKASKTLASELEDPAAMSETVGLDQTLENIKMAYWWAGYYSGLYEGQQQAKKASTR